MRNKVRQFGERSLFACAGETSYSIPLRSFNKENAISLPLLKNLERFFSETFNQLENIVIPAKAGARLRDKNLTTFSMATTVYLMCSLSLALDSGFRRNDEKF